MDRKSLAHRPVLTEECEHQLIQYELPRALRLLIQYIDAFLVSHYKYEGSHAIPILFPFPLALRLTYAELPTYCQCSCCMD